MSKRTDPWYIHVGLYIVIVGLVAVLINVAVIEPKDVAETARYQKAEARLRMENIQEALKLFEMKNGKLTDSKQEILSFINSDRMKAIKDSLKNDELTGASYKEPDPFKNHSDGTFVPDSMFMNPYTYQPFVLKVVPIYQTDSVFVNNKFRNIDSTLKSTNYFILNPATEEFIGDTTTTNILTKHKVSWK